MYNLFRILNKYVYIFLNISLIFKICIKVHFNGSSFSTDQSTTNFGEQIKTEDDCKILK
jgi:hypothetical protein